MSYELRDLPRDVPRDLSRNLCSYVYVSDIFSHVPRYLSGHLRWHDLPRVSLSPRGPDTVAKYKLLRTERK